MSFIIVDSIKECQVMIVASKINDFYVNDANNIYIDVSNSFFEISTKSATLRTLIDAYWHASKGTPVVIINNTITKYKCNVSL